jgi:O-antigen/teichoic acid export membrane protein
VIALPFSNLFRDRRRLLRLLGEGGWIVAGQVFGAVGLLLFVRVVTGYLNPEQYGRLSLAITLGTLVCQLAMSGPMPGIARYYPIARERNQIPAFFRASARLMGYGTVATLGLGLALLCVLAALGHWDWLAPTALSIFMLQLTNYNAALSSIQNSARQRSVVALHNGAEPWVRIGAVAILMLLWRTDLAALAGYAVSALVVLMSQFFFARTLVPTSEAEGGDEKWWVASMWRYAQPFVAFNAFAWAQASSDRWALQTFVGTHDVGLYSAIMQLGYTPITIAIGLLATLVGPILNQRSGEATDHARNRSVHRISWALTAICLLATGVAFVLGSLFHEAIFAVLVGAQFRSVSYLLPWVLLAGGMVAAGQVLTIKLMSEMNTRALLAPKIVTSIVGVLLNFAGAKFGGMPGVVAATVVFAALQLAWLALRSTSLPAVPEAN